MLELILVKMNSIKKKVVKPSQNDGFVTPQKHTRVNTIKELSVVVIVVVGVVGVYHKIVGR